jgi:hypothetical protein
VLFENPLGEDNFVFENPLQSEELLDQDSPRSTLNFEEEGDDNSVFENQDSRMKTE